MITVLPLKINALYLEKAEQVIGQDIQFENIPWMNDKKDVFENPNAPFNTHSIIPRPFSYDNAIYLNKGVHLHFVLPDEFKRFDEIGNLPLVPNRWFIRKESQNGVIGQEWIIESDFIWDTNDPQLDRYCTCTYAEETLESGFKYVGRKYTYSEWTDLKMQSDHDYLKKLTALGWGSMSFDMHYANCRSVFGFHDESEVINTAVYTIIGWVNNEPESNIVGGKFIIDKNLFSSSADTIANFDIAIGNTLPEALTALILNSQQAETKNIDLLRQEEQIEAILNFDSLNDQKLDWVSRLRHKQHENQFSITKGTTKWFIQNKDIKLGLIKISELIKKDFVSALSQLNELQIKYDLELQTFYSNLESLYVDWNIYLESVFVQNKSPKNLTSLLGDLTYKSSCLNSTDSILTQLELGISRKKTTIENKIKAIIENEFNKINSEYVKDLEKKDNQSGVETELLKFSANYLKDTASRDFKIFVQAENGSLSEKDKEYINANYLDVKTENEFIELVKQHIVSNLILGTQNNFNYYEALPPSVIISTSDNNPYLNTFRDNDIAIGCSTNEVVNLSDKDQFKDTIERVLKLVKAGDKVNLNQWKTYKVEWEAQFLSKKKGHYLTEENQKFKEDFLTDSYQLDEQNADLIKQYELSNIAYNASPNTYFGNSFVNSTVKQHVVCKLAENTANINDELAQLFNTYKKSLESKSLFEFTLSDFNNLMIQRSNALSVLPLIPNGFKNHQTLARNITSILQKYKHNINLLIANKLSTFNPLRNGALKLSRLRIIDCFGREKIISPDKIIATQNQTIPDKPNWIALPPRILQPSALDIQFDESISQSNKGDEIKNPVLGWVVPIYLNQHLEFFDAFGKYLGGIDEKGQWEPTPFDIKIAEQNENSIDSIENEELKKVIKWFILHSQKEGFIAALIKDIQDNLEHIDPENYLNPSLLESISSIPIAITKVNYTLFTKGEPAYNLKENDGIEFDHTDQENNFTNIHFPIRFGDINQYNDGLIGYWHYENEISKFNSSTLYINSESVSSIESDKVKFIESLSKPAQGKSIIERIQDKIENKETIKPLLDQEKLKDIIINSLNLHELKLNKIGEFFNLTKNLLNSNLAKISNAYSSSNLENLIKEKLANDADGAFEYALSENLISRNITNLINIHGVEVVLKEFQELLNPKIFKQIQEKHELSSNNISTPILDFLNKLIRKKGKIPKYEFLKYFTEKGNYIWKTFLELGLVQEEKEEEQKERYPILADKTYDKNNYLTLNDKSKSIIVLLHPKANLFVKSGVLPEKAIRLPYDEIKKAIKLIEITLLTSPVITPEKELQISLQKDNRYKWSWISLNKTEVNKPLSIKNKPVINRTPHDLSVKLKDVEIDLISQLTKLNIISGERFFPEEEDIYYIDQNKLEELKNKPDKSSEEENILNQIMHQLLSIQDYNISNPNIPKLVLKEGWLSIKSTQL